MSRANKPSSAMMGSGSVFLALLGQVCTTPAHALMVICIDGMPSHCLPRCLDRAYECPPCACGHWTHVWTQGFLALALGITGGSLGSYLVFAFPPEVRYTCLAIGYNVSLALFGGSAALIATVLFESSGGLETSVLPCSVISCSQCPNAHTRSQHSQVLVLSGAYAVR